ncbi:MAG: trehalose-phosphatase [Chlamydiota bacterium]|nr:trehalose-phosphatase [Chlamydiota bacterium]
MSSSKVKIYPDKIHAVIFDMDGVVTQTAEVHAIAWKMMFDDFLKNYSEENQIPFVPFDSDKDYNMYVDGKPRFDGIRSFLESRSIELPMGSVDDGGEKQTIYGMGKKKNGYFLEYLEKNGIEPFQSTVQLIKDLKANGIKVGIISSSKNCKHVLSGAGVLDLFEVRIDGEYSEAHQITGKPAPDIFLEAASQLGVEPSYSIVVEDAISGVQAGSSGNFALVIGVDRVDQEQELLNHGADVVVKDLAEVSVVPAKAKKDAIDSIKEIKQLIKGKQVAVFLDYDGTMTPIVSRPDLAILSEEMRETLQNLIDVHTVAIISGRDCLDVQNLVGLDGIFYAGSHGNDIRGPGRENFQNNEAESFVSSINEAEKELRDRLSHIDGALIERKKYGVAAHYRLVDKGLVNEFKKIVEEVHHKHTNLRQTTGKKVIELLPKINWNKGKALLWLLSCLQLDREAVIPFYIGDDVTDEDAFKVLINKGVGVAVQDVPKSTFAKYTLKDPSAVQKFLQLLANEGNFG